MNNINELIQKAHSQAKEMGWWDEPRNTGELLMLIVSECGEALEAHRSEPYRAAPDLALFDRVVGRCIPEDGHWQTTFKELIKDSFADELADIVIRIADLLGSAGVTEKDLPHNDMNPERYDGPEWLYNVGEQLLDVVRSVSHISVGEPGVGLFAVADQCYWAMYPVFSIAEHHNIDLWRHIELKLAFNKTRGKKHGKAY